MLWRKVYRGFLDADAVSLSMVMTALLLLGYGPREWFVGIPIRILCIAGLLSTVLLKSRQFWFLITLLLFVGVATRWYAVDNHKFLLVYWCLSLYLAIQSKGPGTVLAYNARMLIGLSFAFATLWKILSPDFLDGSAFHSFLLTDERFTTLTEWVGGLSAGDVGENRVAVANLPVLIRSGSPVYLHDAPQIGRLASALTAWTVMIEAGIACAFLSSKSYRISRLRNYLLFCFVGTTYLTAPVIGFGWLLIVMGTAQVCPDQKVERMGYVACFFLLQFYLLPWRDIATKLYGLL